MPVMRHATRANLARSMLFMGSLAVPAASVSAAEPARWPANVAASYRLYFNGFDVGKYQFQSTFNGKVYTATSNASISALFGAFTWKGQIASSGQLDPAKPKPMRYQLTFKSKSKEGSVTLGFDKDAIKSVALVPNKKPNPEAVPVKEADLKGVFDPMSAILAMTHAGGGKPCERTIPIFDGKSRFNLIMSYKGEQKIADKNAPGGSGRLVVCNVKYQPIAGHKPKDFQNTWVDYDGMEIALRPVPQAHTFVPYKVTIPTTLGSAVMSAEQVTITSADKTQIALTQK